MLLVSTEGSIQRTLVRALEKQRVTAELIPSLLELDTRCARGELGSPQVVFFDLELTEAPGEGWVGVVRRCFARAAMVAFGEDLSTARAARLLGVGVPSLRKPVDPRAFARLASKLCESSPGDAGPGSGFFPSRVDVSRSGGMDLVLESYASARALSNQQRLILRLYLGGAGDKEIAHTLSCSEPTVYEHWRRMGKKAGGAAKSAVISDFHRFLVRN